jgi:hypothetical protein
VHSHCCPNDFIGLLISFIYRAIHLRLSV